MTIVKDAKGRLIDFDAAVVLMDDELREEVADECHDTDQAFLVAYAARHEQRFGEEFVPYAGGAW